MPTVAPGTTYQDPYTGASRYSGTPQLAAPAPDTSSYMDPFTGASRYSGAPPPTAPASAVAATILPVVRCPDLKYFSTRSLHSIFQTKLITFKQANVAAMQGKLHQFDEALQHEIVSEHVYLPCSMFLQVSSQPRLWPCILKKLERSMKPSLT